MMDLNRLPVRYRRVLKVGARVAHVTYLGATSLEIVAVHAWAAGACLTFVLVDLVIHFEDEAEVTSRLADEL